MERLKKDIYKIRFAIIPIIIFAIFMQIYFGTVCPLKGFTGIPCPACGLTHATFYLITGNYEKSFQANPTAILWIIAIALFIIDRYVNELKVKPAPTVFAIVAIITTVWYIFKMINIF